MKIIILSANLGSFDETGTPVEQSMNCDFHMFTDDDFPPITGLSPRFQYRIPKLFGWQMKPGYDIYIWLDGSVSFQREDCAEWFLKQLGDNDILFLRHPERFTIKEEVDHIEEKLQQNSKYLVKRYKNGLHKECYAEIIKDKNFIDNLLLASTIFMYKNTPEVNLALKDWWFWQSRFYSCDQIPLPYILWKNKLKVKVIDGDIYNFKHFTFKKHG